MRPPRGRARVAPSEPPPLRRERRNAGASPEPRAARRARRAAAVAPTNKCPTLLPPRPRNLAAEPRAYKTRTNETPNKPARF